MNRKQKVMLTGGAGFIGSHTCVEMLNAGYEIVVVDNLCNSSEQSLQRIEQLTGKSVEFYQADIQDMSALRRVFTEHSISAVVHFAGLKAVGESVEQPIAYYQNNICGTINLCKAMQEHEVFSIVFSSSATVYGNPASLPIKEDFPLSATNPYGRSKLVIEEILRDLWASDERWNVTLLRYFNPVGAHASGMLGEDPAGIPNNLMPYIAQVASGKLDRLSVFGNDYPTVDGTGVRDYIHVVDLARGHLMALDKMVNSNGVNVFNLGTGCGYSVLEMVAAFEMAADTKVPYQIVDRRCGDIAACYADSSLAESVLGWKAELGLEEMCADTWRWQKTNPDGFG
ncbi:MAG: UDP-glucose 4-epimerase GalE [Gammaproteobacteria bacterium]|nr:UDP-glucose 4-epimerase GalE [Gammaproteobacteria bacterium]